MSLSLSQLASLTVREGARAAFFSLVVAGVGGLVGVGLWAADISLVQADVSGSATAVLMASILPAFFGAWVFFLLRKVAWTGPGEALAVGATAAGLAVVAHRNVLLSEFFARADDSADAIGLWARSAVGLLPREGAVDQTLIVEVAVVAAVAFASLALQRWMARGEEAVG